MSLPVYIQSRRACTENPVSLPETMHSHDSYEIFCLISGDADYCVEGSRYHLLPGDIMLMRKGEVHTFQLRSPARYERMHVNFEITQLLESVDALGLLAMFDDRPLGKFNHYQANLFPDRRCQEYLNRISQTKDDQKRLCYLLPLLSELSECAQTVREAPIEVQRDRVAPIIAYINANLSEELSLEILAEQFFLSKAHLNRIFKQSTGTTAWEYITVKRLFLAKELIDGGVQPGDACLQCGFRDYTTFFRSYKRHFGVSPKEHSTVSSK